MSTRFSHCLIQGSVTLVGLMGAAIAAPAALADNASVSGAVSYTTPAGFSTSISAEKVAPAGYSFDGAVTINAIPGAGGAPQGIMLNSGSLSVVGTPASTQTLKENVIQKLGGLDVANQTGLDAYSAILKAAAGANGLE